MEKLTSELARLYLAGGATRALAIPFPKAEDGGETRHWTRLCEVANALQAELGLPAPAVSISATNGFVLWLSLATPAPAARAQEFLRLLQQAYFPDVALGGDAELPPCLHPDSGKWAAFINPGLGASFADETGLDMAPPLAGQAALLEKLDSISDGQLQHAIDKLTRSPSAAAVAAPPPGPAAPPGLLLKDATLEDIVKFLHAKNIEPTFRHLL